MPHYREKNQWRNSQTIAVRIDDNRDRDIGLRLAMEDTYNKFVKSALREKIAKEQQLEHILDESHVFTVYSSLRDITFILHEGEQQIELLGMCKGEMKPEFARAYAGQYVIVKDEG